MSGSVMGEKLNPEKVAPTGKWAHLLEEDVDHQEWPEQVRDYSKETIESYVYPTMVADHRTADYFSEWVWQTLNDWNEGTKKETTWGEIIRAGLEIYKEKIFPTQEGKE